MKCVPSKRTIPAFTKHIFLYHFNFPQINILFPVYLECYCNLRGVMSDKKLCISEKKWTSSGVALMV